MTVRPPERRTGPGVTTPQSRIGKSSTTADEAEAKVTRCKFLHPHAPDRMPAASRARVGVLHHARRCVMTDARFPERWLNDRRVLRLPDDAFRLFVCGLAWSVANKTDGYLSDEDLALIPGVNLEAAAALYDAELWWGHMHGAQITVFEETQTSRDDLETLAPGAAPSGTETPPARSHVAAAAIASP